jgi:hypothetical protein
MREGENFRGAAPPGVKASKSALNTLADQIGSLGGIIKSTPAEK